MEKLLEMLKGLGASQELATSICEELERYSASIKDKFEKEYQVKVSKAKQVCVEEVNKEKAALAKRVKTFLESKVAAIEQAVASKRAIEESESVAKLKKAKAVLEGVEIKDGKETNQRLEEAEKTIARLQEALTSMKEERNTAMSKVAQANDIAAKALHKNRMLEAKLAKPVVVEGYCNDHKLPFPKDGKCAKCGPKSEKAPEAPKKDEKGLDEKKAALVGPNLKKLNESEKLDESRVIPAPSNVTRSQVAAKPITEISKIADTINE